MGFYLILEVSDSYHCLLLSLLQFTAQRLGCMFPKAWLIQGSQSLVLPHVDTEACILGTLRSPFVPSVQEGLGLHPNRVPDSSFLPTHPLRGHNLCLQWYSPCCPQLESRLDSWLLALACRPSAVAGIYKVSQ